MKENPKRVIRCLRLAGLMCLALVLLGIFDLGRENKLSYTASLALMWKAVLVSPQFLFMTPAGEVASGAEIVQLDDYHLTSYLSYLLWSAPPDAELSALADNGQLHKPEVLRTQVERLLKHERSRALFDSFGRQLRCLIEPVPSSEVFGGWNRSWVNESRLLRPTFRNWKIRSKRFGKV